MKDRELFPIETDTIKDSVIAKHGIALRKIVNKKHGGRHKDEVMASIVHTFGLDRTTLYNWKKGKYGVGRKRLLAVLLSLDASVFELLETRIKS